MIYDLQGQANMSPVVGMLYSAVKENSHRLKCITDGMSDYRGPDHKSNSTAQLIKHVTYVDLNWVYRIKQQPLPKSLSEKYGPMIDENNRLPMVEGMSLNTLIYNYENVLHMLEAACAQLIDADLDKVVIFGHENEKEATIRWGIWHMADHSRYHQAHINQLRKWFSTQSLEL